MSDKERQQRAEGIHLHYLYLQAQSRNRGIQHGVSCVKAPHLGGGYLHDESDDNPYDVDGVKYCGRCHCYLPNPS